MNIKKPMLFALSLTLALSLLIGCAGTPVVEGPSSDPEIPLSDSAVPAAPSDGSAVKTGLSVVTSVTKSKDADADADGQAQANIALVAVTVGDDGVIDSCVIDGVQSKIDFNGEGKLTTDVEGMVASKNELGDGYGMKAASGIGKEWNEQAAALAAYAAGKTVADLRGIAVDGEGVATDADLAASVSLEIAGFVDQIEGAVNNAAHLGAKKGDRLALVSDTNLSKSKDADAEADGLAQAYAILAAVTLDGDRITSCHINGVQANVNFDAQGKITTDLSAPIPSKNELGDDYGMRGASGIGKEWNEQAAAFSQYAAGKTVSELVGLSLDDHESPTDADLAASVTISIGRFLTLLEKAGQSG